MTQHWPVVSSLVYSKTAKNSQEPFAHFNCFKQPLILSTLGEQLLNHLLEFSIINHNYNKPFINIDCSTENTRRNLRIINSATFNRTRRSRIQYGQPYHPWLQGRSGWALRAKIPNKEHSDKPVQIDPTQRSPSLSRG